MSKPGSRFWWYRYESWTPPWWGYIVPYHGDDEYGRRTLVINLPPFGFLVWAYKTCSCRDCIRTRVETSLLVDTHEDS